MKVISYILSLPIRVLITLIFILVIVALGIGWGVRRAFDSPDEQSPATMLESTAPPAAATQGSSTQVVATLANTLLPPADALTSTPALLPSPTPVPLATLPATAGEWESVQSGEGLYMVCRRHCPARWPPDDDALATFAQTVAELNGLAWPPALSVGQRLRMPPCPAR